VNDIVVAVARAIARGRGRAIPIVESCKLSPDPELVFGIAPIRVVSEQRIQAIAFGLLNEPPQIVTIWNPLNRKSDDLGPFANALNVYIETAQRRNRLPRIWLPHSAALEIVGILGERYRTNRNASEDLKRMGSQCHAIVEESKYPGQQAVAVACDLLRAHVATGQSAIEDNHLGALIAWINPPKGFDPVNEAERISLIPAAAMLERDIDDEVERLRAIAKRGDNIGAIRAREQIQGHLLRSARREWGLLVRARRAFWGLGLSPARLDALNVESEQRLRFALSNNLNPPSRPHSLANLLYGYELSMDKMEDAMVRSDRSIRERARRKGRAFLTDVIAVNQPKQEQHPCILRLRTVQPILRIRRGTLLQTLDSKVVGRVLTVREDGMGGKLIELRLEKGVRSKIRPAVGALIDWVDTVVYDGKFQLQQTHSQMQVMEPPLIYGARLPAPVTRRLPPSKLITVAEALRRK
jgi:hypothetical protein